MADVRLTADHYRAVRGDHSDWAEFRAAMVRERRLLVQLPLTRAYGRIPDAGSVPPAT